MASRTQLRLQQITGSAVDIKSESQHYGTQNTAAAITGSDGLDLFGMIGAALHRIHGAASDEIFNNPAGTIRSEANNAAAIKLHADAGANQTIQVLNDEGTGANAIDLEATAGGIVLTSAASKNIKLTNADDDLSIVIADNAGAAANEKITATNTNGSGDDAISLNATAGGVLLNVDTATKKVHVDSEGSVDVDAVRGITITNAADGAARDITIEQTGATDSSLFITSAGTGTDALEIDVTAGDMTIAKSLADGKTLKIGKNGAVEMVFTPHGTAANEKFSITNTSGDSATAIELNAVAGGISLLSGDTGDGIKIGTGTSGVPVTIGHTTSEVTVADNLTVTGDLTVSGDTVTVNTTNLNVEDSIIGLGFSGSNPSPNGDRGILFGKAAISNPIPGLWYDAGNSDFNFATSITDAASSSFGATSAYQNLNAGNLGVYGTATLRGTLAVGSGNTANDLILSSAAGNDLRLDSNSGKVFVDHASTERGHFGYDSGGGFYMSSSAGQALMLDSNQGAVILGKDSVGGGGDGVSLQLGNGSLAIETQNYDPSDNATAFKFVHNDAFDSQHLQISGTIRFNEEGPGGSNYVALRSQATVNSNFTIQLPNAIGSANEVVTIGSVDGANALLSFTDLSTLTAPSKVIRIVTGSGFAAGTAIDLGAGVTNEGSIQDLTLADSQGATLDVFVNGQLLLSGTVAASSANPPTCDYAIQSTGSIQFAFALESDDVVQVIKR